MWKSVLASIEFPIKFHLIYSKIFRIFWLEIIHFNRSTMFGSVKRITMWIWKIYIRSAHLVCEMEQHNRNCRTHTQQNKVRTMFFFVRFYPSFSFAKSSSFTSLALKLHQNKMQARKRYIRYRENFKNIRPYLWHGLFSVKRIFVL